MFFIGKGGVHVLDMDHQVKSHYQRRPVNSAIFVELVAVVAVALFKRKSMQRLAIRHKKRNKQEQKAALEK